MSQESNNDHESCYLYFFLSLFLLVLCLKRWAKIQIYYGITNPFFGILQAKLKMAGKNGKMAKNLIKTKPLPKVSAIALRLGF